MALSRGRCFPSGTSSATNWTVGAQLSVPIFTGGRIRGEEMVAEANLIEAQARLRQTQDAASLDTRTALERLEQAQAQLQASQGVVEQAARAYSIAQVRYREGLSTQVELADSRILLQQAQANRARGRARRADRAGAGGAASLPAAGRGRGTERPRSSRCSSNLKQQQPRQQQAPAADQASAFTAGGE